MTTQEIFTLADQALVRVVDQIKADQWGMKLPEWFQLSGTQDRNTLTLKTIINYHAYDDAWVPHVLDGKTASEVGQKYDGDLLGADPKSSFHSIAAKAIAAVESLDDSSKIVHLSYGDFPATEYLQHITSFRAFRSYDIAKMIGVDTTMPTDLVQGLWDQIVPVVEDWRAMGVYGPAILPAPDANLQTKLLNLVGRQV